MSIDDDFNATCLRSEEEQFADKEMFSNLQYNVFFSNMFLLIVLLQTLVNIVNELELFFNEHRNGWYSTGCFYLNKMFFEIVPILPILCVYVSTCNIYEPVQPGIYPHIVFVIYLTIIATQAHGYICYLACNCNLLPGLILGLGTYLVMLLLGNVYNSLQQLPYIYQLVSYFSIPRFTIQSLVLLEYGFGRCKERQIQPLLYWMDLGDEDYVFCIGMLLLQAIFYRCLALWMLTKKVNAAKTPRWKRAPIVECSVVDQCSSV